ncbi:MAG: hypothetical protein K0S74_1875, partial [Chlamydiales bacterium]|nr:hypothetical protein [Chlamydiales bacterium]
MIKIKGIMDSNYKEIVQIEMKAADLSNLIEILQAACEQIPEKLISSKVGCSLVELRTIKNNLSIHKQTQELAKALLTILKLSVIRLSRQPLISSEG